MRAGHVILTILLLLLPGAAASGSWVEGALETREVVELTGDVEARALEGLVHFHGADHGFGGLTLEAEQVTATTLWQKGQRVSLADREMTRYYEDTGRETVELSDVHAVANPYGGPLELLAILASQAEARTSLSGAVALSAIEDDYLTRVAWSEETYEVGEGEAPGYWYEVTDPLVAATGLRTAVVTGDFDLFLHNVTIIAESSDGAWEHWSGHREAAPGSPLSPFETRVTVLSVRGGRLDVAVEGGLSLLGAPLDIELDGMVSAEGVRGELTDAALAYVFDGDTLALEGRGELTVTPANGGSRAKGALRGAIPPAVLLQPSGQYIVHETPGLVATPQQEAALSPGPWLVGLAAALLVTGLLVVPLRHRIAARLDRARAGHAQREIAAWMATGDRLTGARDFRRAAKWYRRVTVRHAHHVEAWYSLAATAVELGDHETAARAYAEANELLGGDDVEALDLAGLHALKAGLTDEASQALQRLAVVDPFRVQKRLADPLFAPLREDSNLRRLLAPPDGVGSSYV